MRAGLATSVTLHALLLGVGMVSLSAPKAFDVADVESLPVEIIPFDEISQVQLGDKQAPMLDKPAPLPTQRPETVPDAQKVGEADIDTDAPPTPDPKPRPVERSAEPPPAPEPAPKPVEKPVEQAQAEPPKPAPAPTPPEPAPAPEPEKPAPATEAAPEAPAEEAVTEAAVNENVQLPDSAPVPQSRPQPPQPPKVAERPKPAEKPAEPVQKQAETKKEDVLDEVAALLNKEKPSGGGAQRSTEQAALGGSRSNSGERLTQSEMDGLRSQIQKCWIIPAGAQDVENLKVSVQFRLRADGVVEGTPQIISGGGNSPVLRAAAESARRAILRCGPYNLPTEKYDAWSDVIVHFDPSDMF